MIWKADVDWYRWRREFALLPKCIGSRHVWLESYEWRYVEWDDSGEQIGCKPAWRREYRLRNGYQAIRQTNCVGPHGVPLSYWVTK